MQTGNFTPRPQQPQNLPPFHTSPLRGVDNGSFTTGARTPLRSVASPNTSTSIGALRKNSAAGSSSNDKNNNNNNNTGSGGGNVQGSSCTPIRASNDRRRPSSENAQRDGRPRVGAGPAADTPSTVASAPHTHQSAPRIAGGSGGVAAGGTAGSGGGAHARGNRNGSSTSGGGGGNLVASGRSTPRPSGGVRPSSHSNNNSNNNYSANVSGGDGLHFSSRVEHLVRTVYDAKLAGCIESIIQTLTLDLPQDHVFQQLMADGATRQFARVRLGEVVESFLYSSQSQQYHALAMDLATREAENTQMRQDLARAEQQLAEARAEAEQLSQEAQAARAEAQRAAAALEDALRRTAEAEAAAAADGGSSGDAVDASARSNPNGNSVSASNPMSEEEARRELMSILEEATREAELERAREALALPTRAADVILSGAGDLALAAGELGPAAEGDAPTAVAAKSCAYLTEVMSELFGTADGFLDYMESSLETLDALRTDLEEAEHTQQSGAGRRPQLPPRRPPTTAERIAVAQVRERLRSGHLRAARVLDRMGQRHLSLAHECAALRAAAAEAEARARDAQQRLEHAEKNKDAEREAAGGDDAEKGALREELARLRADHARAAAAAAERDDWRREAEALRQKLGEAEQLHRDALREVTAADERLRAQAAEAAREATRLRTAADIAARAAEAKRRELTDTVAEGAAALLGARAELHLTRLGQHFAEACAEKAALLCHHGHGPGLRELAEALRRERQAAGQAALRQQIAEAEALKREAAAAAGLERLADLLRAMWQDEREETAVAAENRAVAAMEAETTPRKEEDDTAVAAAAVGGDTSVISSIRGGAGGGNGAAERSREEIVTEDEDGDATTTATTAATAAGAARTGPATPLPRRPPTPSRSLDGSHNANASASAAGMNTPRGSQYRVPPTADGLCAALADAHEALRAHQAERQRQLEAARRALRRSRARAEELQAVEAELRAALAAAREREQRVAAEVDRLAAAAASNPAKELLGRQDALLKAAGEERAALRDQLKKMNEEFMGMEKRNGTLHERCAAKEQEIARLKALLGNAK